MNDSMENLKRMICKEIDEIAEKGEMSPGDLNVINKLIVTKEKLLRIEEIEEDLGYSEDGEWRANGSYGRGNSYTGGNNSYGRGSSYARDNSYARGRRYSRDGYSRVADDVQKCEVSPELDGSEFLSVASGVNISSLLLILDEHMDVIKLLHPKGYDTLIQKIRELM